MGENVNASPDVAGDKSRLVRAIGFLGIAVLALNSVIGGGIFGLPPNVVARAGLLSPWLFLVVGVLILSVVLTFAKLASYFQTSGGPALYTTSAFGPFVGFGTGWIYYISRVTAFAGNSSLLAVYVGSLWAPAATDFGRGIIIATVCAALTWANYIGVRDGVRTLAVLTVLKLTPIVVLILVALPYVSPDNVIPVSWTAIDDLGGTVLLMIFAFVGFESTTIVSEESKDPRKELPSALVRTTMFIAAFYFLVVLTYVAVLPELSGDQDTLVAMARHLLGPAGAIAITLAAVFSISGNLGAILLAVPRMTFAMAGQRQLPRWFGIVSERYSTPGNSIIFLGGLSLLLALTGSFEKLAIASALTRLITYILCISALPVVHRQASDEVRKQAYRLPGGYFVPVLALAISIWIAAQSGADEWLLTGSLFAIGLVLYGAARLAGQRKM